MNKSNKARSFAEEGLEGVQNENNEAEALVPVSGEAPAESEDLQQVGGLEPIAFFYRFSAPKKEPKNPYKVFGKGEVVTGRYERSFVSGKFNNPTYIIRLADNSLVGLPGTGSLKRSMDKLAEGSKVQITYQGMGTIKGGQWAGSDAHNFIVFGSKLK